MKKLITPILGAVFLFTCGATYAELKIGVVDVHKLVQSSKQTTQQIQDKLKKQVEPDQKKLETKQQELNTLLAQLKRDSAVMRDSDKKKLEAKIQTTQTDFFKMREDFKQMLYKADQEGSQEMMQYVMTKTAEVAKKHQLDLVIPREQTLYLSPKMDLTSEVEALVK